MFVLWIRVVYKNIFLKVMLQTVFALYYPIDQFLQNIFDVQEVHNSIIVYEIIKKSEIFLRKTLASDVSTDAK